jgi:hypothetical protein
MPNAVNHYYVGFQSMDEFFAFVMVAQPRGSGSGFYLITVER